MKFRDPETGKLYGTIYAVYQRFCRKRKHCSNECPLAFAKSCSEFICEHRREAARLMGYEVIEDEKEVNMEKKDKPRLAEVLGVEVGELFHIKIGNTTMGPFEIRENGVVKTYTKDPSERPILIFSENLQYAINHPESVLTCAPRLTAEELAICKAVGAECVERGPGEALCVSLYRIEDGKDKSLGILDSSLFPSVKSGERISVLRQISEKHG